MTKIMGNKMSRNIIGAAAIILMMVSVGHADLFLPGSSSVQYSTNVDNSFTVSSAGLDNFGATGYASAGSYSGINPLFGLYAGANAGKYSDAGIVLYFNGSLKLGQLQNVLITNAGGSNTTPVVNLWLDTGHDGNFFQFSGTTLTGLAGDAYYGATTPGNIGEGTTFGYLGGPGPYGAYTLAELQAGARAGIDANTNVALWIGLTNGPYDNQNIANISQIDVGSQSPVPIPAAVWLLGSGLIGLVGIRRRFRRSV